MNSRSLGPYPLPKLVSEYTRVCAKNLRDTCPQFNVHRRLPPGLQESSNCQQLNSPQPKVSLLVATEPVIQLTKCCQSLRRSIVATRDVFLGHINITIIIEVVSAIDFVIVIRRREQVVELPFDILFTDHS